MKLVNFKIGFWHPFGPHGGETREEILTRKSQEIQLNGWTLWSFQNRKSLIQWFKAICLVNPGTVYALCSNSMNACDPAGKIAYPSIVSICG